MSRAVRRQQKRATRTEKKQQPRSVLPKQQTKPAGAPAPAKKSSIVPSWIGDIIAELRRVVWPSREETLNLTIVVIIVAVAVGLILGGIDIFFEWFIERFLI
jgi:preprotein translocase subunit SecE